MYLACGGALRRCTTGKWLCPLEHCEDVPLRRCSTAKMYHCGALRSCGSVHWSTAKMFELARENVESHIMCVYLPKSTERLDPLQRPHLPQGFHPLRRSDLLPGLDRCKGWTLCKSWIRCKGMTCCRAWTRCKDYDLLQVLVHCAVKFTVDLAKFEVRNMKTNKVYPLQCSGPL